MDIVEQSEGAVGAAWHPDPMGRYPWRWWNGTEWTDHVAAENGAVTSDLVSTNGDGDGNAAEVGAVLNELQHALAAYTQLMDDFHAERIDEQTMRREAFKVGLVVKDGQAWMLDLVNQQWHRYDGFQLQTLELVEREP